MIITLTARIEATNQGFSIDGCPDVTPASMHRTNTATSNDSQRTLCIFTHLEETIDFLPDVIKTLLRVTKKVLYNKL